ncbi:SCO family protein [Parvularcula sp. LCG005]|uniref:SCO family protein n=1 Tax=Parvularcula sp. LCG005 TaxID=3078805 RepID=UPI002941EEE6|nr:SCO family protein [Parvularcula sp. LCG005]WOI53326.1 SCO family protein [Parvularcula sp. LCG005]
MAAVRFFPGIVAILVLAACSEQADLPRRDVIELNATFDADFDLVDANGDAATDERFEGKPMLIYYGFTACPDVCPAALGAMTATLDGLGKDAAKVQPLFITVDPKRDTPDRLKDHLAYDGRILGLTGTDEALTAGRKAMNVYAKEVPLENSAMTYTVDHQRLFYITDKAGAPIYALPDTTPTDTIVALLREQL